MVILMQTDTGDIVPVLPTFWDNWPWWSPSLLLLMMIVVAGVLVWWFRQERRRRLANLLTFHGFAPRSVTDTHLTSQELDELLGGSAMYRSGYITKVDAWWRGELDGYLVDVVDYREWPVPGGPRRERDAEALVGRREMTDRSETLIVFRHEQLEQVPRFLLVPNNIFMSTMAPKGDTLRFGNLRFNKRNRITTPQVAETHTLFNPAMQKLLIDNRFLSIEAFEDTLVFANYGSALGAGAVGRILETARAFCTLAVGGRS